MTTTIGMWEMVSELLEGEKLPVSINEAIEGLCNGDLIVCKAKTLTGAVCSLSDEEIKEIGKEYWNGAPFKYVDFARAILRKAQEK